MSGPPSRPISSFSSAFSLIELLAVMGMLAVLAAAIAPVMGRLAPGNIQMTGTRVQGFLEAARQLAQSKHTYVRVGLAEEAGNGTDGVVIQCIHSTTGDLRHDDVAGLDNPSYWANSARPIVLDNVQIDEELAPRLGASAGSVESLEKKFPSFSRKADGGREIRYEYVIQFDPQGQISLEPDRVSRTAGFCLVNPKQPADPLVFLMSGLSGRIQALHTDELTR